MDKEPFNFDRFWDDRYDAFIVSGWPLWARRLFVITAPISFPIWLIAAALWTPLIILAAMVWLLAMFAYWIFLGIVWYLPKCIFMTLAALWSPEGRREDDF